MSKIEKSLFTECKRCGRKLKTPESQELGMGKVCWKKWQNEHNHKQLFDEDVNKTK